MKDFKAFLSDVFSFETIKYMGAGAVSGGANFCLYLLLNNVFKVNYLISNFVSFTVGVVISYFLNKKYVFKVDSSNKKEVRKTFISFTGGRAFAGFMDMLILYILVDKIKMGSNIAKILDSTVISVTNYLFCKLLIFRKN